MKIEINVLFSNVVFVSCVNSAREKFMLAAQLQSLIREKTLRTKVQGEIINLPASFYPVLPNIFHTFLVLKSLKLICWEIGKSVERKQVSYCPMAFMSGEKKLFHSQEIEKNALPHTVKNCKDHCFKRNSFIFLWAIYKLMLTHFSR